MKKPMHWALVFFLNGNGTFLVVKPDFYLENISSPLDKIRETEIQHSPEVITWPNFARARSSFLELGEREWPKDRKQAWSSSPTAHRGGRSGLVLLFQACFSSPLPSIKHHLFIRPFLSSKTMWNLKLIKAVFFEWSQWFIILCKLIQVYTWFSYIWTNIFKKNFEMTLKVHLLP